MFGDSPTGDLPEVVAGQPGAAHEQLWVEKYGPKSFTDLLSDEQTNRQVVQFQSNSYNCGALRKANYLEGIAN